jgi:hypothetical protein
MSHGTSMLEQLDDQVRANHAVPTPDRLKALIQVLADERQSRTGPVDPMREVFEEVVWGIDMVSRGVERMLQAPSPVVMRSLLRDLEDEQLWLQNRIEVLHELLNRRSAE